MNTAEKLPENKAAVTGKEPTAKQLDNKKAKTQKSTTKEVNLQKLLSEFPGTFGESGTDEKRQKISSQFKDILKQSFSKHDIAQKYNVLILFNENFMDQTDTDNIYSAIRIFRNSKPLLLILNSTGGYIGAAYLIGKLCQEYSNNKFVIVIPRRAKSGATLLSCAADEIHMGPLSEMGPIDPQFNGLPALSLKAAIEHIADLVKDYPQASDMFSKYLHYSVQPTHLGYFERVAESACQYATQLLKRHSNQLSNLEIEEIARILVYHYKDHTFVIDRSRADEIFRHNIVKTDTPEYQFGNEVYGNLFAIQRESARHRWNFYFIGSIDSDPTFIKQS